MGGRFQALGRHLTYANVCATLALTIAVGGGTAWAATVIYSGNIADGTVRSRDIHDRAVAGIDIALGEVTGNNIKNGSISGLDVALNAIGSGHVQNGSVGLDEIADAAETALQGATGAQGPPGAQGEPGTLAPVIPSGATVTGEVYLYVTGVTAGVPDVFTNGRTVGPVTRVAIDLPALAPLPLDDEHVIVVGGVYDYGSSTCTGSAHTPTAPAGYACLYPKLVSCLRENSGDVPGVPNGLPFMYANGGFSHAPKMAGVTGPVQSSVTEFRVAIELSGAPSCNPTVSTSDSVIAWFNWAYTAP